MVSRRLRALRERVAARRERKRREQFEQELSRSRRREKIGAAKEAVREKARGATAPARIEAKAAREELRKTREEFDPIVVPGGRTAARGGKAAVQAAKRGGAAAASGARSAVEQAREKARQAEVDTGAGDLGDEPEDVFARAERHATMADPVGATLDPTTTIEDVQFMAGAGSLGLAGPPAQDGRIPEATALAMPEQDRAPAPDETVGAGLDAGVSVTGGADRGDGPDIDGTISLGFGGSEGGSGGGGGGGDLLAFEDPLGVGVGGDDEVDSFQLL